MKAKTEQHTCIIKGLNMHVLNLKHSQNVEIKIGNNANIKHVM